MSWPTRWESARLPFALAAFVGIAGLIVYRIVVVPDAWILMDFRTNLYYPALALLEGHDPYDVPALVQRYPIAPPIPPYAPLMLLMHAPLALLPVGTAQLVYVGLSMGLTLVLAALALRAARVPRDAASVVGVAALLLVCRPGSMNVMLGQPTLIVALAASVALLSARTSPVAAAFGVAVATCKPQFGVPLALLLAASGAGRAAVGGVLVSGVVTVLTLVAIARGDLHAAFDMLLSMPRNATHIDDATFTWWSRLDVPYLASHLVSGHISHLVEIALAAGVLGIAIAALRSDGTTTASFSTRAMTVTCLAVLLCVYHQAYDALLLTVPATILVAEWGRAAPAERTVSRTAALLLLLLPAVNYLATYSAISHLGIRGSWWHAVTAVNALALVVAFLAFAGVPARIRSAVARRAPATPRPAEAALPAR